MSRRTKLKWMVLSVKRVGRLRIVIQAPYCWACTHKNQARKAGK